MGKENLLLQDSGNRAFFALGRNAIYAACKAIGLKQGDEILTPAFDCDGSLQPFRVLGCELQFFRSDPYTFAADIEDIQKRINPKTRLIHIINHFGMPQPWEELLALREKTGIPILEDNAYSLFSGINNRQFGTFGDISIFSLRKNLPLIDGGMLQVNNREYRFKLAADKAPLFYSSEALVLLKFLAGSVHLSRAAGYLKSKLMTEREPPPLFSDKEGYPQWPLRDIIGKEFSRDYLRPMSKLAMLQLGRFSEEDFLGIMSKKRFYYSWLIEKLRGFPGIEVLWPSIPEGVIPFCVSLFMPSKRDAFLEALRQKYSVMAWPTLPQEVLDRLDSFPEVRLLGKKLFQINLPADKVRNNGFPRYLEGLLRDMRLLSQKI